MGVVSRPRLITIPISHYCEKARWALERAGIDYQEERHLQLFHHWYARRAGGGFTTPVLVLPDGTVLKQSAEILQWVDLALAEEHKLYPAELASRVRATEYWLDSTLGPDGRAWMYGQILPHKELINAYGTEGAPAHEVKALALMSDAMRPYLRARVKASGTSTDINDVRDVFDEIAGRLSDGRPFLLGERFTAADLTFATLSAAVLMPSNYGVELPPVERLPAAMATVVGELREHPAGQFALRMFQEQRNLVVGPSSAAATTAA